MTLTHFAASVVLASMALTITPPQMHAPHVVHEHYTQDDQQARRYVYVPFDVPAGTTQIAISYTYDAHDGGNVVDLGLLEPGALDLGTRAFRGWSGGARASIVVGEHDASPGYWPGALPAGRWHVVLGLYKVAADGVDVDVTIDALSSSTPTTAPGPTPARVELAPRSAGWFAGVLHAHTVHSDGALTVSALTDKARNEHLDFLAITDHNNTSHQRDLTPSRDLLVVSGEEVTTPGGHFNVWGLGGVRDVVDFRVLPGQPALDDVMQRAAARGAVIGINHPTAECDACGWSHAIPSAVNAIEIANGTADARRQAMAIWDTLLRSGRRLTAVGGSDWHRGDAPLGAPVERVWARELSTAAVLDGIRRGRVVVVARSALPTPELTVTDGESTARVGDELRVAADAHLRVAVAGLAAPYAGARVDLVWNGDVAAQATIDDTGRARFDRYPGATGYLRAHVVAIDGALLAVTNPVYVVVHPR